MWPRCKILRSAHERLLGIWRVPFDAAAKAWKAEVKFVQDWPCELTLTARDFTQHAAVIVASMPLRHLNLSAISEAPEVFAVPALAQIISLNGSGQAWSTEAVNALAASRCLSSLRWLNLDSAGLTDAHVEALAASPNLRSLDRIDLNHNPCQNPVDEAAGYGFDWETNTIVNESIYLPAAGRALEMRYGEIQWLHVLGAYGVYPKDRYHC